MQPVHQPARRQPRSRGGFTLIELLVVMVVIGILASLLLPAILSAIRTAREATVVAEISTLDKSLVEFKNRYGVDVPSFIVLYERGDDPDNDASTPPPPLSWGADAGSSLPAPQDNYRRTSRAFIRQVWPDFDFEAMGDSAASPMAAGPGNPVAGNAMVDLNGNGTEGDVLILNGSECLVFFLGGVFTRGANNAALIDDALVGFAANPQSPLNATSTKNRVGPFYSAFLADRFTDIDGDGMPEYRDGLSGQTRPYIYLSSYGGSGYKPRGLDDNINTLADNEIPTDTSSGTPTRVMDDAYFKTAGPPRTYLNPQTYQLISPGGDDFEYGTGGLYNGTGVTNDPEGRDNITNFKGGRLN